MGRELGIVLESMLQDLGAIYKFVIYKFQVVLGYICRYRKALYFVFIWSCFVSCLLFLLFYVSLRNLCSGTCRKIPMLAISAKLVVIFSTHVREHLFSERSSLIFKHSLSSKGCRQSCSADCFEILNSAPT